MDGASLSLVDIWFVETVRLFCLQPQPNQMVTWQKNTLLERAHKQAHKQMCVLSNTYLFFVC